MHIKSYQSINQRTGVRATSLSKSQDEIRRRCKKMVGADGAQTSSSVRRLPVSREVESE